MSWYVLKEILLYRECYAQPNREGFINLKPKQRMNCVRENSKTREQRLDEKLGNSNICWEILCSRTSETECFPAQSTIYGLFSSTWKKIWELAFCQWLLCGCVFEAKMTRIVKKPTNSGDFVSWNTSTRKLRPTVWASVIWIALERVLAAASTSFQG